MCSRWSVSALGRPEDFTESVVGVADLAGDILPDYMTFIGVLVEAFDLSHGDRDDRFRMRRCIGIGPVAVLHVILQGDIRGGHGDMIDRHTLAVHVGKTLLHDRRPYPACVERGAHPDERGRYRSRGRRASEPRRRRFAPCWRPRVPRSPISGRGAGNPIVFPGPTSLGRYPLRARGVHGTIRYRCLPGTLRRPHHCRSTLARTYRPVSPHHVPCEGACPPMRGSRRSVLAVCRPHPRYRWSNAHTTRVAASRGISAGPFAPAGPDHSPVPLKLTIRNHAQINLPTIGPKPTPWLRIPDGNTTILFSTSVRKRSPSTTPRRCGSSLPQATGRVSYRDLRREPQPDHHTRCGGHDRRVRHSPSFQWLHRRSRRHGDQGLRQIPPGPSQGAL